MLCGEGEDGWHELTEEAEGAGFLVVVLRERFLSADFRGIVPPTAPRRKDPVRSARKC